MAGVGVNVPLFTRQPFSLSLSTIVMSKIITSTGSFDQDFCVDKKNLQVIANVELQLGY
jgi:hypothetical protein